ncbi:MAG TPA: hypothetical protein EYO31_00435, partial [Phycisphaerales bacterium]|nr:hypothetical protein [Phycisphaerales bacterium]
MTTITLPLSGLNAVATATLPNGAKYYSCFVQPTSEMSLVQIPKGPNPRDIDEEGTIPKDIEKSYLTDDNFAIKNRGIRAVVDVGSVQQFEEDNCHYISFDCTDPDGMTGHYDGQHSMNKVMSAIAQLKGDGSYKDLPLHLT